MFSNNTQSRRKGIYLLPNLITISSLLCGFYAAINAIEANFIHTSIALMICVILDGLDGNIARLTHTTTRFGEALDSLTDVIVFGFVPALAAYHWSLYSLADAGWLWSKVSWLVAFFYTSACVLRLARFSTQSGMVTKHFFRGLPCPAAAMTIASLIWLWEDLGKSGEQAVWILIALMVVLGIAMVSNLSYLGLKGIRLNNKISFIVLPFIIFGIILATIDIPKFLFSFMLLYLSSGILLYIIRLPKKQFIKLNMHRIKNWHK